MPECSENTIYAMGGKVTCLNSRNRYRYMLILFAISGVIRFVIGSRNGNACRNQPRGRSSRNMAKYPAAKSGVSNWLKQLSNA